MRPRGGRSRRPREADTLLGGCSTMKDVLRIAIVDPNEATRDELPSVLLGMESVWLDNEPTRYEFFDDVIRQSPPDVVIVSLDSDQAKALQLIASVAQQAPGLPILAVSARG